MAAAAASVVHYQVHNVQVIGAHHGHASGQLLAGTVAQWHRPFLVLGAQVVIIERIVTDRMDARGPFPHGGQPDGSEPRLAKSVGLLRKVVPPPVGTLVTVCRARNPFVARPKKACKRTPMTTPFSAIHGMPIFERFMSSHFGLFQPASSRLFKHLLQVVKGASHPLLDFLPAVGADSFSSLSFLAAASRFTFRFFELLLQVLLGLALRLGDADLQLLALDVEFGQPLAHLTGVFVPLPP